MRFALLGKCFAVGERLERMETLEFEEVRIYCINVSTGEIVIATRYERGMLIVEILNFSISNFFELFL